MKARSNLSPERKSTPILRGRPHDCFEALRWNARDEFTEAKRLIIHEIRKNLSGVFEREIPVPIRYPRFISQFLEIGEPSPF